MVPFSKLDKLKFLLFDLHGVVLYDNENAAGQTHIENSLELLQTDLERIYRLGLKCGVISGSEDDVIINRIREMGIEEVFSHSLDKVSQAEKLLRKHNLTYENIGYVGDDILDIPLLMKTGFSAAPREARREVKRIVNYVTRNTKERTVLSDILEMITKAKESGLNDSR
ncbi:MAG: HAD hydrolase family protein [Ignavibacteriales bacterium]